MEEVDAPPDLRVALEQVGKGPQPLRDPLRVVDAVDADADLSPAVVEILLQLADPANPADRIINAMPDVLDKLQAMFGKKEDKGASAE